ncbi:Fic family protein [Pedobacter frigoris]|uniref:Fic family protein n=1 Tax=Pedobacter frigoris TaxID=2571272 RepID=A0A4U1CMD4_9SPHI|nr:Fic family protein [Pedobacter frigoris]TKC08543.1 Fic family protein [Pedobacter frigoris]
MSIEKKLNKINVLQRQIQKKSSNQEKWNADFIEQVKIDFTFSSNKLEGNSITYGQTIQILKDFITPKDASVSDFLDIVNHKKVLDAVFENYESEQITEANIKKLHKELMKSFVQWSDGIHPNPGSYKIMDNRTYRSNGKEHIYLNPEDVLVAMAKLIDETNEALKSINIKSLTHHPLTIATNFHYQFLNIIHPFGDGNGRLARIFMNLILLQQGFPPIFIKVIDKTEYFDCFTKEEKIPGTMLDFMADRMIESLKEKKKFLTQRNS